MYCPIYRFLRRTKETEALLMFPDFTGFTAGGGAGGRVLPPSQMPVIAFVRVSGKFTRARLVIQPATPTSCDP